MNIPEKRMKYCSIIFVFLVLSINGWCQEGLRLKTVVIDAGHGGRDPGALGAKVREKDVVLSIALKLGKYINENFSDVKVVYTRDKDEFIELTERARIANQNKADLFISIHANWIKNPAIQGTETFVLGLHRSQDNLEVAKKENAVIVMEDDYTTRYEGFDPNSTESYIIFELMQNAYLDQSIHFASLVENQFATRAGRESRGVKQAGFLVIRETSMPSVLVEAGYLTNKNDEAFLATDEGRSVIASAIFRAFRDYKSEFEAKSKIINGNEKTVQKKEPKKQDDITFKIQIATSPKQLVPGKGKLKQFSNAEMYYEKGTYKYTIEPTSDFIDAKKKLAEVKKRVSDAFIVAFENNSRISLDSALVKLNIKQ
jgi:N-acetylmuramoyl-L-alanine amidase